MTDLPPELAIFANLLDTQPSPVRTAFQYCLALLMVKAGKTKLVDKQPGEELPLYTFEAVTGDHFTTPGQQ